MSPISKRGGARAGAGRKPGSGRFLEHTVVKRVPASLVPELDSWLAGFVQLQAENAALPPGALALAESLLPAAIPLMQDPVRAGFPSPAASYTQKRLDFNDYLVSNAAATIAVYAAGNSMADAGIDDGDMLVVNRSREAINGDIVVAQVGTEFTVKRLRKQGTHIELHPENARETFPVIVPTEDAEWQLIGVVTFVIKKL
ncbi:LexA family protein [Craterilacuibacter sinensis]|nr:translesion error-prone DNA polymerase V autoproteolytic subunit [Craterilacuibacter sinensis]